MTKCADAAFGWEYFSETGFYVHKNPRTRKLNTFSLSMDYLHSSADSSNLECWCKTRDPTCMLMRGCQEIKTAETVVQQQLLETTWVSGLHLP